MLTAGDGLMAVLLPVTEGSLWALRCLKQEQRLRSAGRWRPMWRRGRSEALARQLRQVRQAEDPWDFFTEELKDLW